MKNGFYLVLFLLSCSDPAGNSTVKNIKAVFNGASYNITVTKDGNIIENKQFSGLHISGLTLNEYGQDLRFIMSSNSPENLSLKLYNGEVQIKSDSGLISFIGSGVTLDDEGLRAYSISI